MDTKANQRLPLWWILILAPLGYAGTNLFHWLASPEIQELTGIGQYRIFSLLVYTLATGIAVIVYMVLLKSRGMTMKAAGYRSRLTWKGAMAANGSGYCSRYRIVHYLSVDRNGIESRRCTNVLDNRTNHTCKPKYSAGYVARHTHHGYSRSIDRRHDI